MPTFWQISRKFKRPQKFHKCFRRALRGNPQKAGHLAKNIIYVTPRKPNSAKRRVAWIRVIYKKRGRVYRRPVYFFAYLNGDSTRYENEMTSRFPNATKPGNSQYLKKDSFVLIRGGRTQDLPGLKYKIMRSKQESRYTLKPLWYMKKKRSKYASKKIYTKKRNPRNKWKFNFKYY